MRVSVGTMEWQWWTGHPDKNVDIALLPLNPIFAGLGEWHAPLLFVPLSNHSS